VNQPEEVRGKIGFLTSELKLEDFFTPNYLFAFFSQLYGIVPEVMAERKAKMFERFGINKFAEVKVANLSTGMKQKLSLVISLVHNPDIIIFDEPTNGLDVLTARTVTDYLQELRDEGKTIILSTHIFSLVERLCDRVGIIIDGRMTACGTLDEVCNGMTMEDRFFEIYKEVKGGEE
jgi:sodium transport system ATP-binding protein